MRPLLSASCSGQNSVLSEAAVRRERHQLLAKDTTPPPRRLAPEISLRSTASKVDRTAFRRRIMLKSRFSQKLPGWSTNE